MENLERAPQQNTVNITRVFDAPRETVWKAWTDPQSVKQWWGPRDYTCPAAKIDLRLGGKILNAMKGPDGKVIWGGGTITEITKPSRISYTDSFTDENGNIVDPTTYGMPADFARELYVTVTFEEQGPDKTKMTLVHKPFPSKSIADECVDGWSQSFDKLEELLEEQPGA